MVFPFDVRAAMTTALASRWAGDGGGIRRGRPQIQAPQLFFVPQVQQASAQRGRGETPARQQTGRGLRHGLAVSIGEFCQFFLAALGHDGCAGVVLVSDVQVGDGGL